MKNQKSKIKNQKCFTLIDVLVGIFLMLIVFLGIFGVYQLGFKIIGLNERKITATQIAQGEIEKIRNLPYLDVGIIDANPPFAKGILEQTTTTVLNEIEYKIERAIKLMADEADNPESCLADYKKAEIKVSWSDQFPGQLQMVTDVSPKDKVEEAEVCQEQTIGILSVSVFDALGQMIFSPLIEVFDPSTGLLKDSATPSDGKYDFILSPSSYKVSASKSGYSTERTFSTEEIAIPEKPNPIVLEGEITQISFSIDKVSSFLVKTLTPWGMEFFSDSFSDESQISEKENVSVSGGQANLATTGTEYFLSGYLFSNEIFPTNLIEWVEFSFSDQEPEDTDLRYQIYYASDTDWLLIPDSDLAGNSTGFDSSPVDLSNLATSTFLKLKANFLTNFASSTPILFDWQVSWKTSLPTPIGNADFNLRGEKLIGKDIDENPVYKYSTTSETDSSGQIQIQNLEWDNYHFSIPTSSELSLVSTEPDQPVSLSPDTNLTVNLYLESQNSLLVTVQDLTTLQPIFSATTTLTGSSYQKSQYTNEKGQTLFIPLDVGSYNLLVEAPGFFSTSTTVYVSGNETETVKLQISD